MPKTIYCWRCRMDMPMLTEEEWATLSPYLDRSAEAIMRYRDEHDCSLEQATEKGLRRALEVFERLTGFRETNPNALWHHRLAIYGPPCHACGKPLRTPKAGYCASCSAPAQRT